MRSARVLVVDDDQSLLLALSELIRLRIDDLAVDTCDTAESALERVGAADYDAIVADIKMPGMDGLELLGEIRALNRDIPTLLITGHGDQDLAIQALRAGAYDYITKPIDRAYFVTSLKQAIDSSRVGRDVAKRRAELERRAQDLEQCVREAANELRELLQREWAARAELHLARCQLATMHRQPGLAASAIPRRLAGALAALWGSARSIGHANPLSRARGRGPSAPISGAHRPLGRRS